MDSHSMDPEKQNSAEKHFDSSTTSPAYDVGSYTSETKAYGVFSIFEKVALYFNAEVRGIERVPDEEKNQPSIWTAASMWLGGNMVVATFALGCLGISVFGLSFWDSFLTIVFFTILGAVPVAYYSVFGPIFGLRQMVFSRFWFGYQGVRVCALLNCIACVGWSAVNTIVSAQMLHTVNNGGLPPWGGILIITFLTFIVTFLGHNIVHAFEKWSWVPNVIIFLIIAIRMGISGTFTYGTLSSGSNEAASILSFGAAIYGFATGWASYASDYTVYMPKNTNRWKLFFSVLFALCTPIWCCMILGTACMTGTLTSQNFADQYANNGIGGLFFAVLVDDSLHGFGQFCIVVLALSTVSNNIPNMYSLGLSAQTVWSGFMKVPRVAWTFFGCAASIAISIPAYIYFEQVIDNFMNLIGYWLSIYHAVGVSEHFIYRGGFSGYDVESYNKPKLLPISYAALFAFCCGAAGAAVGMAQVWWTGPLAAMFGTFGGDIGFELSFGFAFVGFNLTRWAELKYIGR